MNLAQKNVKCIMKLATTASGTHVTEYTKRTYRDFLDWLDQTDDEDGIWEKKNKENRYQNKNSCNVQVE